MKAEDKTYLKTLNPDLYEHMVTKPLKALESRFGAWQVFQIMENGYQFNYLLDYLRLAERPRDDVKAWMAARTKLGQKQPLEADEWKLLTEMHKYHPTVERYWQTHAKRHNFPDKMTREDRDFLATRPNLDKCLDLVFKITGPEPLSDREMRDLRELNDELYVLSVFRPLEQRYIEFVRQYLAMSPVADRRGWENAVQNVNHHFNLRPHIGLQAYQDLMRP